MAESTIQAAIFAALNQGGRRLFRNNVGRAETVDGRFIQYGLCVGSSDLIGWQSVTITPDMVGQQVAVFTAVEVKSPGKKAKPEQQRFIDAVKRHGGRAGVATSVQEAAAILGVDRRE